MPVFDEGLLKPGLRSSACLVMITWNSASPRVASYVKRSKHLAASEFEEQAHPLAGLRAAGLTVLKLACPFRRVPSSRSRRGRARASSWCTRSMACASNAPEEPRADFNRLGQRTSTSRVVNAPPIAASRRRRSTDAVHRDPSDRRCAHDIDLPEDAVDQLVRSRLPTISRLHAWAQEPAFDPELWATLVLLGVDHEDPVVSQRGGRCWLDYWGCVGRGGPGRFGLRGVQAAADAFFAGAPVSHAVVDCGASLRARMRPPSFGCLSRMRSSRQALRRSNSRRAELARLTGCRASRSDVRTIAVIVCQAADGLGLALVDGFRLRRQRGVADPAHAGVPQAHALLVLAPRSSTLGP